MTAIETNQYCRRIQMKVSHELEEWRRLAPHNKIRCPKCRKVFRYNTERGKPIPGPRVCSACILSRSADDVPLVADAAE